MGIDDVAGNMCLFMHATSKESYNSRKRVHMRWMMWQAISARPYPYASTSEHILSAMKMP